VITHRLHNTHLSLLLLLVSVSVTADKWIWFTASWAYMSCKICCLFSRICSTK